MTVQVIADSIENMFPKLFSRLKVPANGILNQLHSLLMTVSFLAAKYLMATHFSTPADGSDGAAPSLLIRMTTIADALDSQKDVGSSPLNDLKVCFPICFFFYLADSFNWHNQLAFFIYFGGCFFTMCC